MIHQPPPGARDLLPLEVAQKCWINDRLLEVFHRWGYQRIVTSTLERLDTLTAGGAISPATVIQLQENGDGVLGLRPELTASIARAAVARMASNTTQRLCYRANVFRHPGAGHHGQQLEFYQAGVELLFAGGILADAEIILLLVDCLHHLGLDHWQLILGEAGLTRSLLALFPESLRKEVRDCIVNLDFVSLENLPLSDELRKLALFILDLRGKPTDVLQKVASLNLDESGQAIVENLKYWLEVIEQCSSSPLPLILDLSLLQTIDYYTGIVFQVVAHTNNQWRILGQGGRYDQLLKLYDPQQKSAPGIGFALNIEDLHACLLSSSKLPQQKLASDWLVIPQTKEAILESVAQSTIASAFVYAQKLRQSQNLLRVEIYLDRGEPEQIREYALSRRIHYLAWIQADGTPKIEYL